MSEHLTHHSLVPTPVSRPQPPTVSRGTLGPTFLPRQTSRQGQKSLGLLKPATPPSLPGPGRCVVKGCVFPGTSSGQGWCNYHQLQYQEPGFFESLQPSLALLGQARYGLPDSEPDDSRRRDRRRQVSEREAFLLEAA